MRQAFAEAEADRPVVLAFTNHDFRDMRPDIDGVRELLVRVGREFPDVPFVFSEALTAMREALQLPAQPACELEVTLSRTGPSTHVLDIRSQVPTFGPQPWLALRTVAGTYHHDNLDIDEPFHRWRYVLDEETYPLGALDAIGLAANNAYGTTTVVNVDPATGVASRRVLNDPSAAVAARHRVLIMDPERPEILEAVVASPELSIADAIAQLDMAGTGGLVLCRPDRQVAGLLTDGDIRRAVLRKVSLADPCGSIATADPVVAHAPIEPAEALQVMLEHDINHLPVVDEAGVLIDFLLRKNLVADVPGDLSAVVMAGGFGTRLLPLTETVPKPMLPVGERPMLERTIDQLRGGRDQRGPPHHPLPARQHRRPLRRRRGIRGPHQLRHRG